MDMLPLLPLAFDVGNLVQLIIFVVILLSGIAKAFSQSKEEQKRQQQRAQRRRNAAAANAERAPARGEQQPRSEVDEFLQRVSGQQEAPPVQAEPPRRRLSASSWFP